MVGIFKDDSSPEDRRAAAIERLMFLCPSMYRVTMRPLVEMAMRNVSDDEVRALLVDIDLIPQLADSGDAEGITALARKYGATDAQVDAYLPLLTRG